MRNIKTWFLNLKISKTSTLFFSFLFALYFILKKSADNWGTFFSENKEFLLWILGSIIMVSIIGLLVYKKDIFSKRRINKWSLAWYIIFAPLAAIALCIIIASGLWIYQLFQPEEERASWGFTKEQYSAKNAQPSNGGESVSITFSKKNSGSTDYVQTISYKYRHTLKGGQQYKILMDKGGFNIIPKTYGVWYTFTLKYVNDPRISHTMSVMQVEGEHCVHERIVGNNRPQGLYYITPSQDVICEIASPENHPVCNY
jgi:hypothetical protein